MREKAGAGIRQSGGFVLQASVATDRSQTGQTVGQTNLVK